MADPVGLTINYSFAGYQASSPQNPLPADKLDALLASISTSIGSLVSGVKDVRRSDGALKNGIVTFDSLADELQSAGLAPLDAWATGVAYKTSNVVAQNYALYKAAVDHTSGAFATDLAAGKWTLIATLPAGPQGVQGIQGIQGVQGNQGAQGTPGAEWYKGATDPDNAVGINGDFYLQTAAGATGATGDVWEKSAGAWAKAGVNLRGPAGSGSIAGATVHGIGIATAADAMASTAAPTDGQILVGQSGADPALVTISGDATFAKTGVLTVISINGVAPGGAFSKNVGTTTGTVAAGDDARMVNGLRKDTTAQISKGFTLSPANLGNMASFTVDPTAGNYQYGTNNAAITITAPASDCAVEIWITNSATAGAITFSGFTVNSNTGEALDTTSGHIFILQIRRVNGVATYTVKALQ